MKKYVFVSILLLLCMLFTVGCGGAPSPEEALSAFTSRYPLPAGRTYLSGADPYDETYLSPAHFDLIYARAEGDSDREDIQSYALFFGTSLREVNEMGIFLCYDRDAAFEVAELLRGRIDTVRLMTESDISHTGDAEVTLFGTTVVYTILDDNPAARRTLSRILS